ncbi:MAG: ATP-binding cassette domain-containing protein [Asgard group archaeon]|nr:ATP-binding cassette domain-containing protein [Asgard group archaeon]
MIECYDVIKIYSDEEEGTKVAALRGIDLNIKEGELVSVIGPSGSGKTTLIKILAGIENISSGEVIVDGKDLTMLKNRDLLKYRLNTIGLVHQMPERTLFLSGTVMDNLTFSASLYSKDHSYNKTNNKLILEQLGIDHLADRRVSFLSGGEMIRTAIACMLAKKTKVILCDEPTGQLDSVNTEIVKSLLRKISHDFKTTVLVVTHDLRFLKGVDRTCEIHSGRVSSLYNLEELERQSFSDYPIEYIAQIDSSQSVRLPDTIYNLLRLRKSLKFSINEDATIIIKHPEGLEPEKSGVLERKKRKTLKISDLPEDYFDNKDIDINLNNVSKIYSARKLKVPALTDVTLKFYNGEFAFIIGPSGSGKSTLIKIMTGMEPLTNGEITITDTNLNKLDDGQRALFRRMHFGIVSQQGDLHPTITVMKNLFLKQIIEGNYINLKKYPKTNIDNILEKFQITHRQNSYPLEISGGELQRASLAVAQFDNPSILVLDEPTANMDSELAGIVMDNLYSLHSKLNCTLLITTHDISLVRDGTRVIELQDGKIIHDGLAYMEEI